MRKRPLGVKLFGSTTIAMGCGAMMGVVILALPMRDFYRMNVRITDVSPTLLWTTSAIYGAVGLVNVFAGIGVLMWKN